MKKGILIDLHIERCLRGKGNPFEFDRFSEPARQAIIDDIAKDMAESIINGDPTDKIPVGIVQWDEA